LRGAASVPGGHSLVEDVDLVAATPGDDINWLEDVELLEEASPCSTLSNSF
jgi:hypothetical protein